MQHQMKPTVKSVAGAQRKLLVVRAYLNSDVSPNVKEARQWIAAWKARQPSSSAAPESSSARVPTNVLQAREWIAVWKARQRLEASLLATPDQQPSVEAAVGAAPEVPANVLEAREWIAAWKARREVDVPMPAADPTPELVADGEVDGSSDGLPPVPTKSAPVVAADGTVTFTKDLLDTMSYEELLASLQSKV